MLRFLFYIAVLALISFGLYTLGQFDPIIGEWGNQQFELRLDIFAIVVTVLFLSLMLIWWLFTSVLTAPKSFSSFMGRRRKEKGIEALSGGLIALGSGDRALAQRYASQARRKVPNEPMTAILRAQAAQLAGDHKTARRIYESMLASRDTELIGLRGLYLEAIEERDDEAAKQYSARALRLKNDLPWACKGLFDLQCRANEWEDALKTLTTASNNRLFEKAQIKRYRAVLLTAQAIDKEESAPDEALELGLEAHGLAPDLVPAAEVAGRLAASQGKVGQASRIIQKTWRKSPHPDLAVISAYARTGDSPKDRLQRVISLANSTPGHREAHIAIASAAVDARDWAQARESLTPIAKTSPTKRVCTLMARIEGQAGDKGRVREWLARAVHAPQDAIWTADGHVSEEWAPVSPVNGKLDAFQWVVPVQTDGVSAEQHRLELLLASTGLAEQIGHDEPQVVEAEPIDVTPLTIEADTVQEVETPAVEKP